MKRLTALLGLFACLFGPAQSHEFEASMRAYVQAGILDWVHSPIIVSEVRAQNVAHRDYTPSVIARLDRLWRAEVARPERPTIDAVLNSPASSFLLNQVDASGGVIAEIFVTDNRGLLAASSGVTSDYWQGDEPKFHEIFAQPSRSFHVGEIAYDDSAREVLGQISFALVDPLTSKDIGVVTVGLVARALWATE